MKNTAQSTSWVTLLFSICLFGLLISGSSIYAQSNFSVHGYLTQGYAMVDKNPIFGISTDGTSDYRTLALQFRYEIDDDNFAVVQFNHRRIGTSPIMQIEPDVTLDWGFFGHRFNDNLTVKVGKILLPFGIYNEIRDVGIILPFYRAPFSAYGEEGYMSETLNGIVVTHTFDLYASWEIEWNVYAGDWTFFEWGSFENPFTFEEIILIAKAKIDKGLGLQAWLLTPLDGVRIGAGALRGHVSGGLSFSEEPQNFGFGEQDFGAYYFSLDASFERFYIRSEFIGYQLEQTDLVAAAYYAQVGVEFLPKIHLNLQADIFKLDGFPIPPPEQARVGAESVSTDLYEDFAIGINYHHATFAVLKFEYHWNRSVFLENGAGDIFTNTPAPAKYFILSLATSF